MDSASASAIQSGLAAPVLTDAIITDDQ